MVPGTSWRCDLPGERDAPSFGWRAGVHDLHALDANSPERERLVDPLSSAHVQDISMFLEDCKLFCVGTECPEESVFKFGRRGNRRD